MKQQLTMGQFALTRQLLMGEQKQPQLAQQQQQQPQKPTKVTKVRRTRQSRNPQVSVARRNERERNRVKMVNNGFARLRDHLPVEYLQQNGGVGGSGGYESAGSETPDLALGAKSPGSQSSKAKKFSKVETLRAAIKHINMLVELIRSAEPDFRSVGIIEQQDSLQQQQQQQHHQQQAKLEPHQQQLHYQPEDGASSSFMGYDDVDGPMSCGDGPLSCGSSSSLLTSSSLVPRTTVTTTTIQPGHQQHIYQNQTNQMVADQQHQQEQFVKLEPTFVPTTTANESANQNKDNHIQFQAHHLHHHHQQQQQPQHTGQPASPFDSARTTILTIPLNQHGLNHYSQAPTMMTQVHPHQTIAGNETSASEHTQLWIQQHQSSFIEQQQQQQQQQQHQQQQQQHHDESQSTASSSTISPNPLQQQQPNGYLHDDTMRMTQQPIYYSQQNQLHFQQQQSIHQNQHYLSQQQQQQQLSFNDLQHARNSEPTYSDLRQQSSNTLEQLNRNHYGNSTVHRSAFVAL